VQHGSRAKSATAPATVSGMCSVKTTGLKGWEGTEHQSRKSGDLPSKL